MFHRSFHSSWIVAFVAIAVLALSASAFAAGMSEEDVPSTSIVPAEGPSGAAPAAAASAAQPPAAAGTGGMTFVPAPKSLKPVTHHPTARNTVHEPEIEPAEARLKVIQDQPVYSSPAKSSKHIEQLTRDKFVNVTGSTHYFLQVKLKSGQTGYIEPSAVELVKPTDKIFMLNHDAAVLDKPNRWAKKLAEVHQGHNVHVVGISLNYMQIRMKSGLEGFIPMTALE